MNIMEENVFFTDRELYNCCMYFTSRNIEEIAENHIFMGNDKTF